MERAKEELEVKDSLLAELYVSHIAQRQTIKTEFQVFLSFIRVVDAIPGSRVLTSLIDISSLLSI